MISEVRLAVLWLAAGCGRFGFGSTPSSDAPGPDTRIDGIVDARTAPVAEYTMDDDPSTGIITGNSPELDGSCTRCPTSTAGKFGTAYAFDGTTELRLSLTASALVGSLPYTVSVWIDPTTAMQGAPNMVITKPFSTASDADVYSMWVNESTPGQLFFETTKTGAAGAYDSVSTPAGLDARGAWHHVATSWDGTTKRLYADGVMMASAATTVVDSTQLVMLGADIDNNVITLHYTGAVDELRLYDRALGDAEIAALAQ